MQVWADFHTHTRYSDGRGSVAQMVAAGQRRGLRELALTDHGPANIAAGVAGVSSFKRLQQEVQQLEQADTGIRVLCGCEADVVGLDGEIDIPQEVYQHLDLLLVGLHPHVMPVSWSAGWVLVAQNQLQRWSRWRRQRVEQQNTEALAAALRRHPVSIVSHPGLGMPVDIEEIARVCAQTGAAFEINTGHHYLTAEQLSRAARQGAKLVINSDAHYPETVGDLEQGLELVRQAGVAWEQVVNVH